MDIQGHTEGWHHPEGSQLSNHSDVYAKFNYILDVYMYMCYLLQASHDERKCWC